jgi:hypothetical protein
VQNRIERVLAFPAAGDVGTGEQVQVVVAEHRDYVLFIEKTQCFQRLVATIDQVTDKPEPVMAGIETDLLQ